MKIISNSLKFENIMRTISSQCWQAQVTSTNYRPKLTVTSGINSLLSLATNILLNHVSYRYDTLTLIYQITFVITFFEKGTLQHWKPGRKLRPKFRPQHVVIYKP